MSNVPFIPDTAPFTPQQRAWLNGFFAGLYAPGAPAPAAPLQPLTILFGSQTGNAEGLAKKAAAEAGRRGFAPTIVDMAQYAPERLGEEKRLLLIASTYGDGEPPDNARGLWDKLKNGSAPDLKGLEYSMLALGDSNYPKFCEFGKVFDRRLEALGARPVHPRIDCDTDFDEPFQKWLEGALGAFAENSATSVSVSTPTGTQEGYSKKHPFPARLLLNRKLNGEGSAKDTRHLEISLESSGMAYEVGDALGVVPTNCPQLVGEILKLLGCDSSTVLEAGGQGKSLRDALLQDYEITRIPKPLLRLVGERSGDAALRKLLDPGSGEELSRYLWGREIVDLLLAFPQVKFQPAEFIGLLKKLQPRLYSISSSPKAHPGQVHLTVAAVRYESLGRGRKGVCSTFLADRVSGETPLPIYVHPNKGFRPPADPSRPMIMVGPGTGIAPFRAFLEEHKAAGASGKTWLFFGDQHEATDFLYHDEFIKMLEDGVLTRLDTAFSRDQAQKIYVQHRILENADELFAWLEDGASFYVCGDASRMAKDVDSALHQVIAQSGGRTAEAAVDYVKKLRAEKRYQRDVY